MFPFCFLLLYLSNHPFELNCITLHYIVWYYKHTYCNYSESTTNSNTVGAERVEAAVWIKVDEALENYRQRISVMKEKKKANGNTNGSGEGGGADGNLDVSSYQYNDPLEGLDDFYHMCYALHNRIH